MNIFEALRKRYPAPAWAFMEEVRNGTGYGRTVRTADALAMSLYPSRGTLVKMLTTWDSPARAFERLASSAAEIAKVCQRGAVEAAALLPKVEEAS